MDSSQAPLIAHGRDDDDLRYDVDDAAPDTASDAGEDKATEAGPGIFMLLLTFAAGISGLLFGCKFSPSLPYHVCLGSWC